MIKPKYKVGDTVIVDGIGYQSANGTLFAGRLEKEVGQIKKVAPKGSHQYKIEGIDAWFNERNVQLYRVPTVEIGDKVKPIKYETYRKAPIKISTNLPFIIKNIDKDVATICVENNETLKFRVNVYNLEKI